MAVVALLLASMVQGVAGNSMYLAKHCRGETCDSPKFPILDYDPEAKKCVCRAHPCWDDNGVTHSCPSQDAPHLIYSYDKAGKLSCGCSKVPHYETNFIAKHLCPGEHCDGTEHPILDYDEDSKKCHCRAHPCWDDNGNTHSCPNAKFPILRYREDYNDAKEVKKVCECVSRLVPPNDEL
eukprot:gb/GFBE01019400.1/.p1 GENE.gb/GFBE01019400.1/~~gb/GFBE01019400.1/.p1  ORF type:complete len:180 (+),score=44.56 gb/GFBE01019400.1/:1-540(+)